VNDLPALVVVDELLWVQVVVDIKLSRGYELRLNSTSADFSLAGGQASSSSRSLRKLHIPVF